MALFKAPSEKTVLRDERPLLPDYLPSLILHREAQLSEMAAALQPAVEGRKPRNILAYGPTGTGKGCAGLLNSGLAACSAVAVV